MSEEVNTNANIQLEIVEKQLINEPEVSTNVPKRVFIVPYRNRVQHKFFFEKYMSFILEGDTDYEIYFSHQCDARSFNRGAVKNIGFLAIKEKYPEHYKDITFIFNDVDTVPFNKIFDYQTTHGVVKHYYGFKYTLGGIVVMKGADFELINGFPNFWAWGNEDNCLQKRCQMSGLLIDRSVFYQIGSPQILQLFDGMSRLISKRDPWRMSHDDGSDGLFTIYNLSYSIDKKSKNPNDNIFISGNNDRIFIINIDTFLSSLRFEEDDYFTYDLREPPRKIVNPDKIKKVNKTIHSIDDWTNIPYYPTLQERKEEEKYKQMSFTNNTQQQQYPRPQYPYPQQQPRNQYPYPQQQPRPQYQQHPNTPTQINNRPPPHIYSREYANYVGAKPRASASARIGLGGVMK